MISSLVSKTNILNSKDELLLCSLSLYFTLMLRVLYNYDDDPKSPKSSFYVKSNIERRTSVQERQIEDNERL